jgi:tetratricopeptide (TPR) repeat protein
VPSWLTDSLTTDEFAILQLDRDGKPLSHPMQDEPTTPVTVIPAASSGDKPITQRATAEARTTGVRPIRETIPAHEAANVLNQARASQKMGDVSAMLDSYERLIRSEVALEDVETDMERVSKDAVHKSNPAVLRVYGDALLRRGKLQQALDTYRAALNLL